jgi:hypothetical protein
MDEHGMENSRLENMVTMVRQMRADCLHILEILAFVDGHFGGPPSE